jgi:hypothetical protein
MQAEYKLTLPSLDETKAAPLAPPNGYTRPGPRSVSYPICTG